MTKLINWMTDVFAPRANKIARNPWVAAIQESILTAMPVILIGSFATLFNVLRDFLPFLPDLGLISSFSFGLLSLFLAYLIPATVMEKKRHKRVVRQAGLAGIALFLIIISPIFDEEGNILVAFGRLGTEGMLATLISGLFVAAVMNFFAKHSFFKKDSEMPDFITVWFDTLIPITLILVVGWVSTYLLNFSVFEFINWVFSPFIAGGQSFLGFVLFNFLAFSFLYSFGISTWVLYPVMAAILFQGFGDNLALVAAGESAKYIHTNEVLNMFLIGGGGTTLALNIMMLGAKSKKLKAVGRSSIVPSIFNINEPLVFGAPMAFNPLLMIPMWIVGLVGPILTYVAFSSGFLAIPLEPFWLWYLPSPIVGYIVTNSIKGAIVVLIIFAASWLIYYPFYRAYDKQLCAEEVAAAQSASAKKSDK